MSTTGWEVASERHVAPELAQRVDGIVRAFRRPALPLEHERADAVVDRREMPMQELLGLVRLRGDVHAFAQFQRRLERGRPVATGAHQQPALVV